MFGRHSFEIAPGASSNLAHGGGLTYRIIGLAIRVHRRLVPGLAETIYEAWRCRELKRNEILFRRQVSSPATYDDILVDVAYVADAMVGDKIRRLAGSRGACRFE